MTILELAAQSGLSPKWKASTGGGEFSCSCPICGGKDRFYIQPNKPMNKCNGFYSCRRCGITGDAIQFARQFLNLSFREAAKAVDAIIPEKSLSPVLKKFHAPQLTVLTNPPKQWIAKATDFFERAHKQLLPKADVIEYLKLRGLPIEAIQRYKFGWSTQDQFLSRTDWGLEEQLNDDDNPCKLWIPKGLVIPIRKPTGEIIRLKVRRPDWKDCDKLPKYVAISGSMNGLSIMGDTKHTTMIVVESELDAYAIDHVAHDFAFTVAVGSNIKNPDNLTNYHAKRVSTLLICHDTDEAGYKMLTKWRSLYQHAQGYPTPIGKDIGEAIQNGFNIREWLLRTKCDAI
ncbi:MAG: toprim domain-containing protein [Candidatus Babeliales bacterium]|nr:toprim domain-containing protein [Candidatus Babeliales bacterium]